MSFATTIEHNRRARLVPNTQVELRTSWSKARIRCQGSFLTKLVLRGGRDEQRSDVVYCDFAKLDRPDLPASHLMSPVGKHGGVGGEHGYARYADFDVVSYNRGRFNSALVLRAGQSSEVPVLTRRFQLYASSLVITSELDNRTGRIISTSMGEHYYFPLENGDVSDVTINGQTLDKLIEEGTTKRVQNGEAVLWSGFNGLAQVELPNMQFVLNANCLNNQKSELPVAAIIWQRSADSPYVCIDPVVGVQGAADGSLDNRGLLLDNEAVELITGIHLL